MDEVWAVHPAKVTALAAITWDISPYRAEARNLPGRRELESAGG
jgi:hypothetical protein